MIDTIYKYMIPIQDEFCLALPEDAQFLTLDVQRKVTPVMWFKCDPEKGTEKRTFHVIGTGHWNHRSNIQYLGTFQIDDGNFVGHVFESI